MLEKAERPADILIVAERQAQLNELVRAAEALKRHFTVLVYLDTSNTSAVAEMTERCLASGVEVIAQAQVPASHERALSFRRLVRMRLGRTVFRLMRPLLFWARKDRRNTDRWNTVRLCWETELSSLLRSTSLVATHKPRIVIVGEDGVGGNGSIIAAAHDHGAKVIVVPYEYSKRSQILKFSSEWHADEYYFDRWFFRHFPKWLSYLNDRTMIYLPAPIAAAKESLGTSPRDPWTVHGGDSDFIAVENDFMRRHYIEDGIAPKKLQMVGALANDDLRKAMYADGTALSSFHTGKKRISERTAILCAFPPSYVGKPGITCEFGSYRDLVDFWIGSIMSIDRVDPVFQLHPAVAREDVDYIRSKVPVSLANITSLIPLSDILVTSSSSIIRMAVTCKKPVINYDVYGFDHSDYDLVAGVTKVLDKYSFADAIKQAATSEQWYSANVQKMSTELNQWGHLDGRCGDRLRQLIDLGTVGLSQVTF